VSRDKSNTRREVGVSFKPTTIAIGLAETNANVYALRLTPHAPNSVSLGHVGSISVRTR